MRAAPILPARFAPVGRAKRLTMEDEAPEGTQEDESGGGGLNVEVLRSYLAFAKHAILRRKLLIALVAVLGVALSVAVAKYLPRTYTSGTVMVASYNGVLDSDRGPQPLAGAENQIMSHENLEALIRDTNLKKKYGERRRGLLAVKDKLIATFFGPMDDKVFTSVLVGTLQTKISVTVEKDALTILVDWSDGQTAAELAEATRESFLRMRNNAEISAFQEKMAILDSHAGSMRQEIEELAKQMKDDLTAKKAERTAEAKAAAGKGGADVKRAAPVAPRVSFRPSTPITDEQLPVLREHLATLKQKLSQAENDRSSRMRDEQAKLDELKLRLTPNHPQVITQEERVGMASQVSSELSQMRSEAGDLESQIRQRESMAKMSKPSGGGAVSDATTPGSDALPNEILGLLDQREVDPALSAQMSGAIVRYGALRDDVRGAKLALDTAQAAFNHRYQVVAPVEVPNKPTKPKVPVVLGVGIALSLLLAFLLPVLLEVRRDLVVERWQVHHFQLPVLAELKLPSGSKEQT
jgi:uncharacterized protein involved in exopolysaccharide biosynthesis